jgi:hypothetical protein
MDIDLIQTTLIDWAKSVVSLPVRMQNKPVAIALKLPAEVILSGPMNIVDVGVDYAQWSDGTTGMSKPTVIGHREFDIGVRVVSRSQAGNKSAQFWLEKLRAALTRPSTIDTFEAAGIAVLRMSAGAQFDAPFEERFESIAAATWRVTCVITDADDAEIPTLTSIGFTSRIEGEDGSVLPAPPNVVDELITVE